MLKLIMQFYEKMRENHSAGVPLEKMISLPILAEIASLKWSFKTDFEGLYDRCSNFILNEMEPSKFGIA
jgi:hypothetical protein